MSMYLDHFGLREVPFSITPHTEFFFSGANRGSTLDALIYAITHDEGIVKVTGEVGSGKTMLCRMLLEKLPANVVTVYLANPSLSRDEILFALADELGMEVQPQRIHQLLRGIQAHLVTLYAEGKQVVVLIDEAHAMPRDSLEEVRLLSNLESKRHKLLKIVLFGQPELDEMLTQTEMRQLRERVTHNFGLEPLTQTDIGGYLMFRMRAAGYHGPDLFTPAAMRLIADASLGLSRRINILADKALLAAFVDGEHQIGVKQTRAAIKDAQFGGLPVDRRITRRRTAVWLTATLVVGALVLASATVGALRAWAPPSNPAAEAAPATAAPARQFTPTDSAANTSQGANNIGRATGPASAEAPLPLQASVELSPTEPKEAVAPAAPPKAGRPMTARFSSAFDQWIARARDRHYFIQLMRTNKPEHDDVERYLHDTAGIVDPEQLRVYRSRGEGQDWLGVIYGDFPSLEAAQVALDGMPPALREAGAYPRRVGMLK